MIHVRHRAFTLSAYLGNTPISSARFKNSLPTHGHCVLATPL